MAPERRKRHVPLRTKLLVLAAAVLLNLSAGEAVARLLTWWNWEPERIAAMTIPSAVRGRYASHPDLPYTLAPDYESTNSLGFRGREFEAEKPAGLFRIVCVGASTTYGPYVGASETHAALLEALLRERGHSVQVINAGVPGWVSQETLVGLRVRVLPLEPDLVIVYQGRNELFPQSYNHFRADYSHYRDRSYRFAETNVRHKALFRYSHLAMLLCTYKGDRLGWSSRRDHPLYGSILYENRPGSAELVENLQDPQRNQPFRNNVEAMVRLCREQGSAILLCTMAFQAERLATGNLVNDPAIHPALQEQVAENNAMTRAVAEHLQVPLAETAVLAEDADLMKDDCHFLQQGHARRAAILLATIEQHGLLPPARED